MIMFWKMKSSEKDEIKLITTLNIYMGSNRITRVLRHVKPKEKAYQNLKVKKSRVNPLLRKFYRHIVVMEARKVNQKCPISN